MLARGQNPTGQYDRDGVALLFQANVGRCGFALCEEVQHGHGVDEVRRPVEEAARALVLVGALKGGLGYRDGGNRAAAIELLSKASCLWLRPIERRRQRRTSR